MSKNILVIAVVAVVAVGAFFAWQNLGSSPGASLPSAQVNPSQANPGPQPKANPPQSPLAATTPAPVKITYTNLGFSPELVTIKSGTTVIFQNQSDSPFWPASNPHPVHNGYPKDGGCTTSTFDACKEVNPGSSWSFWPFKFDIVGSWRYHDHLRPANQGTIVVQ